MIIFPNTDDTVVLLVDVQEKLLPVIHGREDVLRNCGIMLAAARELNIKTVITEQYPSGLGHTVEALKKGLNPEWPVIEKTTFSCLREEKIVSLLDELNNKEHFRNLVIIGIETHVCVLQTALDALRIFPLWQIFVPFDCVASRNPDNKANALKFAEQQGINIINLESLLFMLLKDARHPSFRSIVKLVK